jgi:hypothetical protein
VALPRGCLDDFTKLLTGAGIEIKLRDERDEGRTVRTRFLGELTPEQDEAAALLAYDTDVLAATTALCKTVVAAKAIADRA